MPQAREFLREKFADEGAAFDMLGDRFGVTKGGIIYPKDPALVTNMSDDDEDAILYLIEEWDYGFSSEVVVQ